MTKDFRFHGFTSPNTTPVPDDVFDVLAPELTEAELRVLLYIIRRTFGFKKHSDSISLKQLVDGITTRQGKVLDRGTGLSKSAAARGVRGLVEKEVILATRNSSRERGDEPTTYTLRFLSDDLSQSNGEAASTSRPVSSKRTRGVVRKEHGGVLQEDTQETVLQETDVQDIYPSNIRKTSIPKTHQEDEERHEVSATRDIGEVSNTEPLHEDNEEDTPALRWTPRRDRLPEASERARSQPTSLADVLSTRTLKQRSRPPGTSQKRHSQEHQQILAFIEDFARELGDEAPLQSSVTRALNLYAKSGIPMEAFLSYLYEARSITKEYSANVTKQRKPKDAEQAGFWPAGKNKMPYFFGILEELTTQRGTSAEPSG